MSHLSRIVRGFFGFWYSFVIGDDWLGAAGVAVLIGGTWVLLHLGVVSFWFGPSVIAVTATALVARALRRSDPGSA